MPELTTPTPYLNADGLEIIAAMIRAGVPLRVKPDQANGMPAEAVAPTLAEAEALAAEFPGRVRVRLWDLEQVFVSYFREDDVWYFHYPGRTLADLGFLTRTESLPAAEVPNA